DPHKADGDTAGLAGNEQPTPLHTPELAKSDYTKQSAVHFLAIPPRRQKPPDSILHEEMVTRL
ncbi:MAG: hypothetical protein ABW185_01775, partial [Sedimenticola sp.]